MCFGSSKYLKGRSLTFSLGRYYVCYCRGNLITKSVDSTPLKITKCAEKGIMSNNKTN